jgi:hypothetical protein
MKAEVSTTLEALSAALVLAGSQQTLRPIRNTAHTPAAVYAPNVTLAGNSPPRVALASICALSTYLSAFRVRPQANRIGT